MHALPIYFRSAVITVLGTARIHRFFGPIAGKASEYFYVGRYRLLQCGMEFFMTESIKIKNLGSTSAKMPYSMRRVFSVWPS